ncbi:MAG: hypothetical protein Kow0068_24620 [Marinilabiliales bacterium]
MFQPKRYNSERKKYKKAITRDNDYLDLYLFFKWMTRGKKSVRLNNLWMINMHELFSDIEIFGKLEEKWHVDMQLHAYLCTLTNNSVQYK